MERIIPGGVTPLSLPPCASPKSFTPVFQSEGRRRGSVLGSGHADTANCCHQPPKPAPGTPGMLQSTGSSSQVLTRCHGARGCSSRRRGCYGDTRMDRARSGRGTAGVTAGTQQGDSQPRGQRCGRSWEPQGPPGHREGSLALRLPSS